MLYRSKDGLLEGGMLFAVLAATDGMLRYADVIFHRTDKGLAGHFPGHGPILATVAVQFIINGAHDVAVEWAKALQGLL